MCRKTLMDLPVTLDFLLHVVIGFFSDLLGLLVQLASLQTAINDSRPKLVPLYR
jgi:hypothetical protein